MGDEKQKFELIMRFGQSSSDDYVRAVALARGLPGYRKAGRDERERHTIVVPLGFEHWERLNELREIIEGWKSAEFSLNGRRLADPWKFFHEAGLIYACFQERLQEGEGEEFCIGQDSPSDDPRWFGCRYAVGVKLRDWRPHSYRNEEPEWYRFGMLSPELDSFLVDKAKIEAVLRAKSGRHVCATCPAFSWKRLNAVVTILPQVLEVGDDKRFHVRFSEIDPDLPIGIQPHIDPSSMGVPFDLPEDLGE